ncbi:dinitrogenase iron-molybdenum cofactor [bacterium]|nr:dinitrogenase iron-molybdenum cofactor [bacterium]MBU1884090.1 dinitrogenase iron-molybdenum cofactor [bacterium]
MKIAVPVDVDKESIFKKTGQAPFFAIFNGDEAIRFEANSHHTHDAHEHDEHDENHEEHVGAHKKDISGLKGCDVILVQAVGEHMREALESLGIRIKKIRKKDGLTAIEAVKNFLENRI